MVAGSKAASPAGKDALRGEQSMSAAKRSPADMMANADVGLDSKPVKNKPRGMARIKAVRKLVDAIIRSARLEISSLHISDPDTSGMCAKGKIRLTHLATGPIPLVGLQVKFKDPQGASLHWTPVGRRSSEGRTDMFIQVYIEPLTLKPGTPGSVSSEVDMRFVVQGDTRPAFIEFVKHMLRSDPKEGTRIRLRATGVQVKTFGLRFGGLEIEKDVILGGLGCLGGALIFDNDVATSTSDQQASSLSAPNEALRNGRPMLKSSEKKKSRLQRGKSAVRADQKQDGSATQTFLCPTPKQLEINDMDIIGGHAQKGIQVKASVVIENPARDPELIIEPGELRFALCMTDIHMAEAKSGGRNHEAAQGALPPGFIRIGVMTLAPMVLRPGPTKVEASGYLLMPSPPSDDVAADPYTARAYEAGQQLLARILQNESVDLCAVATRYDHTDRFSGVSNVGWLAEAFEGTRIDTRIPPLGDRVRLLDGAEIRVEDEEGNDRQQSTPHSAAQLPSLQSSIARATLRNGFMTDVHVHDLTVRACSAPLIDEDGNVETLELGKVFSPGHDWNGLTISRQQPAHVSLPMEINPDPRVLIEILRKSARSRNVDLGNPLTELLDELRMAQWNEAGFAEPPKSRPNSSRGTSRRSSVAPSSAGRPSQGQHEPSDDLASLLASALANMRVTAYIEASASIGQYRLPGKLVFEQRNLPIALSTATAAALLPLVGKPFVKAMVDRAEVGVEGIDVQHMDDRGIQARIALKLLNFGPLSAEVVFDNGLHLREIDQGDQDVAIIHFDGPLSIVAGSDDPVYIGGRIVPATGSDSSERFSNFVGYLLRADLVTYSGLADPLSITSGGVHFRVSLEKHIALSGLGGFSGLRMNDLQILGETSAPVAGVSFSVAAPANTSQPTAISFSTIAQLRNEGDIRLHLSRLEVAFAVDGVQIGQASIEDLDLRARTTASFRAKGVLYAPPPRQVEARKVTLEKISKLIEDLLAGKETYVQVLGRRAWVPDTHGGRAVSLAWLDAALRTFQTKAVIQWKGGVQIVNKIDVGKVEATFTARNGLQLKIDEVSATYSVPFPVQFDLLTIDATINITYANKVVARCHAVQDQIHKVERTESKSGSSAAPQGRPHRTPSSPKQSSSLHRKSSNGTTASSGSQLGRYPSSSSLATSHGEFTSFSPTTAKVKLSLKAFDVEAREDDVLGDMISHIFQAGPRGANRIFLRGEAHISVRTVLGTLRLAVQLGIDHKLDLSGLDGLRNSPLRYTDFDIVSANPKYIQIKMNIQSHNPSENVTIHLPDSSLSLSAYYDGSFVGDVIIGGEGKGVSLGSGPLSLNGVEFRYRPTSSSEQAVRPVISRLFSGLPCELSIRGHRSSSVNSALVQALRLIDVPIEIAPLGSNDLLSLIKVQLGISVVTSNSLDATYLLDNPINLPIDVLHLEVDAFYRSQPFGKASKTYHKDGVVKGRALDNKSGSPANGTGSPGSTQDGSPAVKGKSLPGQSNRTSTSSVNPRLQRLLLEPQVRKFQGALVVKLSQPLDQLVKAFLLERGNIVLDVRLRARLDVEGYIIPHFEYRQDVPLEVSGLQGVARLLRLI